MYKRQAVLGIYLLLKRRKRRGRLWRKPWVACHDEQGAYNNLVKELELYGCLHDYLRITKSQFLDIVQRVTPILQRKNTNFRAVITPGERVAVTLRFLATGAYADFYDDRIIITATV